MRHDTGVRTFQFLDDLKALVELGEDIHHRTREESMLRRLQELEDEGKSFSFSGIMNINLKRMKECMISAMMVVWTN